MHGLVRRSANVIIAWLVSTTTAPGGAFRIHLSTADHWQVTADPDPDAYGHCSARQTCPTTVCRSSGTAVRCRIGLRQQVLGNCGLICRGLTAALDYSTVLTARERIDWLVVTSEPAIGHGGSHLPPVPSPSLPTFTNGTRRTPST